MSSDPFDGASSSFVKFTEFTGSLLLISPRDELVGVPTSFGPADATVADVVVLDGDRSGEEHTGVRIFQRAVRGQLSGKVGRKVLGRLGMGTAKDGQSAPYLLAEPTEDEKTVARKYIDQQSQPLDFG